MEAEMKFACYADRPLHVLNSVNCVWHNMENSRGNTDLYLFKEFHGFPNMEKALKESGVFRNVYLCKLPVATAENAFMRVFTRAYGLFFPQSALKQWCGTGVSFTGYDVLLFPAPVRCPIALQDMNPNAKVWFIEEGSASYLGSISKKFTSKYRHLLYALFHKGPERVVPSRLFVNNVALCNNTECPVFPLPASNPDESDFARLLENIFGSVGSNLIADGKIIFLSQPLELMHIPRYEFGTARSIFERTLSNLIPYRSKTIVRPHPREQRDDYQAFPVDKSGALWELLCSSTISDNHILIGAFSTAQLTPKLLYNKEPFVIFTCFLYSEIQSSLNYDEIVPMIDALRVSYRNPQKIAAPKTWEEYQETIKCYVETRS